MVFSVLQWHDKVEWRDVKPITQLSLLPNICEKDIIVSDCLGARECFDAWLTEEGGIGAIKPKVFHIPSRAFVILLSAMNKLGIFISFIIALANVLILALGYNIANGVVKRGCILALSAVEPTTA